MCGSQQLNYPFVASHPDSFRFPLHFSFFLLPVNIGISFSHLRLRTSERLPSPVLILVDAQESRVGQRLAVRARSDLSRVSSARASPSDGSSSSLISIPTDMNERRASCRHHGRTPWVKKPSVQNSRLGTYSKSAQRATRPRPCLHDGQCDAVSCRKISWLMGGESANALVLFSFSFFFPRGCRKPHAAIPNLPVCHNSTVSPGGCITQSSLTETQIVSFLRIQLDHPEFLFLIPVYYRIS